MSELRRKQTIFGAAYPGYYAHCTENHGMNSPGKAGAVLSATATVLQACHVIVLL
jgi:hypothetical protein